MFRSKNPGGLVVAGCLVCQLLFCGPAHAQTEPGSRDEAPPAEAFRVMARSNVEGPEITPFLRYQSSLAWRQDELRRARWSQVRTEAELHQLRSELKTSLLEMIGGLPSQRTDLHAKITGQVSAKGFHVEKLIYQSLPGFYVTALLYVPENGQKVHPAILVPAGHSSNGKIHYQDLCQRLVQRGYLVISWDPVGQGERSQFWDTTNKKSRYNLICAEHAVLGNLAYLAGANLARWEIWDGMRALDYLLTRPDVDGGKINVTGTSGGGFQAALLGALDDRIRVIIPSCYITALAMRMENRIFADPDSDPEQDLFGFLSKGVDHAGLLLMMYPRAVMVAGATLDFFPIQGTHKSYSEVRSFYERFGHGDRIAFAESYNTHQYSLKNQEAALDFLDRFNGMPLRRGLAPVITFREDDLLVTKSGQVSLEYQDAQPLLSLIQQYAAEQEHHDQTTLAKIYRSEQDPKISYWKVRPYDGSVPASEVQWEKVGSSAMGTLHVDRYLLHHSTYLEMPLVRFHRDGGISKGSVVWLSLQGKAKRSDWPEISKLLNEGYEVFSFDYRGLGETRMNYRARSPDDPGLVQGDFDQAYVSPLSSVLGGYVYNSLLTGRPYFLQMMDDLEIVKLFLQSRSDGTRSSSQPLTIAATADAFGVAARFKEIEPKTIVLPVSSPSAIDWATIVASGQEQWPIAFLMPSGVLINLSVNGKSDQDGFMVKSHTSH
jgi:hypothetical protein